MTPPRGEALQVIPSARRLVQSLRDVGYDFVTAVADLIDNSIAAGATNVAIELIFDGPDSALVIEDNGLGMTGSTITEAMRFGSNRDYEHEDLGKFGLGLKTASLSQCRRLTVASRSSLSRRLVEVRVLDLDHIERTDRWEVLRIPAAEQPPQVARRLHDAPGTVVIWERLDRLLAYHDPWGERANRKLRGLAEDLDRHLGMVFHRFLTPPGSRRRHLTMSINGTKIEPWDPFLQEEPHTERLPEQEFEVTAGRTRGLVRYRPFVLPPQQQFSSSAAWQRASGPQQWNRQQGFYIYRGDRLIQAGGWSWMRSPDEHTKLARAALEFWPPLDGAFEVNVAKVRVKLPDDLRALLRQPVQELVRRANTVYRQGIPRPPAPLRGAPSRTPVPAPGHPGTITMAPEPVGPGTVTSALETTRELHSRSSTTVSGVSAPSAHPTDGGRRPEHRSGHAAEVLEAVARAVGEENALQRIADRLRRDHPEVAHDLGWS